MTGATFELMPEVTVTRRVLIATMLVVMGGCYREPDPEWELDQDTEPGQLSPELVMPSDSIHAGLSRNAGAIIESQEVEIGSHGLTAPSDWVRRKPSSQFLLAEFSLPKADAEADDGRLTVSTAGGTVEDNVKRWRGQFGDAPAKESQETLDIDGVTVTFVDYAGTFTDQRGPIAAEPKSGYRMLGAIIPLKDQLFFVKATGEEKTMAAHVEKIRGFLQSLKIRTAEGEKPSGGSS